jgi:hypothetical protein
LAINAIAPTSPSSVHSLICFCLTMSMINPLQMFRPEQRLELFVPGAKTLTKPCSVTDPIPAL